MYVKTIYTLLSFDVGKTLLCEGQMMLLLVKTYRLMVF